MRYVFALFFCSCVLSSIASSASIPFVREIDSPFPSGTSDRENLNKKIVDSFSEVYLLVKKKDGEQFWVNEDEIVSWKHLANELICKKETPLYSGRNTLKEPVSFCKEPNKLSVLGYQNNRFRVKDHRGLIRWVEHSDVTWSPGSMGKAYLKKNSYLQNLDKGGRVWLKAPASLEILKYYKNDVFVSLNNKVFRAARDEFVTPLDLASKIRFKSGKEKAFYLLDSKIQVGSRKFDIPSKPLLVFSDKKLVLKSSSPQYYFTGKQYLQSQVSGEFASLRVIQKKEEQWHQSSLPKHGLVYWHDYRMIFEEKYLSDAKVFSKEIYDLASSPLDRKLMFASAGGLFRKLADNKWQEIKDFSGKSFPLHFAKSGRLFVGHYYSDDSGKTFKAYIPWHKLIAKLQLEKKMKSKDLRVIGIKAISDQGDKVRLQLTDGNKETWVEANIKTQDWKLL